MGGQGSRSGTVRVPVDERICVIGAGPAGLATAHHLAAKGYGAVTVLEKLPRVGGLCDTFEYDRKAFDLGANYVTSSYTRIRQLAEEVGAEMYVETSASFYDRSRHTYRSLASTARGDTGFLRFGWSCLKYLWKRWRLSRELPSSGFAHTHEHADVLCSFGEWLDRHGLSDLRTLFEIPITLMGYGELDEIPAPYALTYMRVGSVTDLMVYAVAPFHRWPRRFVEGFGRFWERIAEPLDVRTDVHIHSVERSQDVVTVDAEFPVEVDGSITRVRRQLEFDRLILCCPLQTSVTGEFLDLSSVERELFDKITLNPFAVTTFVMDPSPGFEQHTRVVNVSPTPARTTAQPTILTQQFKDNPLVTFYTPVDDPSGDVRSAVLAGIRELAKDVQLELPTEPETWNNFPYFPQVTVADFRDGWYRTIEAMQGEQRTYYNGGIMAFELVEPIVEYSQNLVDRHFLGGRR